MSEAKEINVPYLPGSNNAIIKLGPANKGSVTRLAIYAQHIINNKLEIPPSPFCEWAADRICGKDRQDLVMFLQGRRGSGKSYSFLYLGKRLGEAISRRKGGTWKDYFSMDNCATLEDTENVLQLTNSAKMHQVVLIDDCSIAISNRSWNSQQNRNFNALLSVCRTKRWILLLTAPLKKHVDNQTREMCDINCTVAKSFHKGGFNVIKANSSEIGAMGKEYNHRMKFMDKKINFWVAFAPDEDLVREYDKKRDDAVTKLNSRIVETGRYDGHGSCAAKPKVSRTEQVTDENIKLKGDAIRDHLIQNPEASLMDLSCVSGISQQPLKRMLYKMGLSLHSKKGRKKK